MDNLYLPQTVMDSVSATAGQPEVASTIAVA
jgi:hypothetical protein